MPPASTRAVRFDRYGGTDVLYVADVPTPKPGPGEVLVEVRAAAINPGEAAIRSGFLDPESTARSRPGRAATWPGWSSRPPLT
jgi:NADPH:quinone reductase